MIRALIHSARPRQWVKNSFVAAALVFSKHLLDGPQAMRALCAVAIFCVVSSAVYLWNDVIDVENDRAHPTKRMRPVASGALPLNTAKVAAALMASGGIALALLINQGFAAAVAGYVVLNCVYSLWLKHVVFVDVLCIALFFILRVAGGAL